jgi:hypothetical protein
VPVRLGVVSLLRRLILCGYVASDAALREAAPRIDSLANRKV